MITAVFILQVVMLLMVLALFYFWQRPLHLISVPEIAKAIAAQLLDDYARDLYVLNEPNVCEYTREKYLFLSNNWGLPMAALDTIEAAVWQIVKTAVHGAQPEPVGKGFSFYD